MSSEIMEEIVNQSYISSETEAEPFKILGKWCGDL